MLTRTIQPVWAGEPAQLDLAALTSLAEYLTQDPRENPIMLPDLAGVASDLVKLGVTTLSMTSIPL